MFKPMLCPNEKIDLKSIIYPQMVSYKLDGIRCIFKDGEMVSRSLKHIPNAQLQVRFASLMKYSSDHNILLDGELWCRSVPFNELSGIVRQLDCKLPDDLFFYCFDCISNGNLAVPFSQRVISYMDLFPLNLPYFLPVDQWSVFDSEETEKLFQGALKNGFEGLILKNPYGYYKTGRATIKENLAYKVKPFCTTESKVIDIVQSTEVDPSVEKKINELGYSKTSRKKADRILIERASAVKVLYNGQELKVTLSFTNEEKEEIWKNRTQYIGKFIEFKFMEVGMKEGGLPRHPTSIRWRNDKD